MASDRNVLTRGYVRGDGGEESSSGGTDDDA
jgi:hypothetical protein